MDWIPWFQTTLSARMPGGSSIGYDMRFEFSKR
jgi:hypothetical protein